MRITFTQSGGFAGLVKGCRIDTDALEPDERREAEAFVEGSGLAASGERLSEAGRDLRQYEITIERGGAAVHFVCDEKSVPAAAAPLVHWLAARARPQPPR